MTDWQKRRCERQRLEPASWYGTGTLRAGSVLVQTRRLSTRHPQALHDRICPGTRVYRRGQGDPHDTSYAKRSAIRTCAG